jgi:hypothetical protein
LLEHEREAWKICGFAEDSFEGREIPKDLVKWDGLNPERRAAVQYGLGLNQQTWDEKITGLQRRRRSFKRVDEKQLADFISKDKRSVVSSSQSGSGSGGIVGSIASMAWGSVKAAAPLVGRALRHTKGKGGKHGLGFEVAALAMEKLPSVMDDMSDPVEVRGVETILYLDDSQSMKGANIMKGHQVLSSMSDILKENTRIVKFGSDRTVLYSRENSWSSALVHMNWDGSSGGTYMWKMIQDDVMNRYRPAGYFRMKRLREQENNGAGEENSHGDYIDDDEVGAVNKLRVVVITDGYDCMSPGEYQGMRGMDPMMAYLLKAGFNIEWHVVLIGEVGSYNSALSAKDAQRYRALAGETGGSFIVASDNFMDAFSRDDPEVSAFLDALESSDEPDQGEAARAERRLTYRKNNSARGEDMDWLKLL